jgi:hypothetical protein
VSCSQELADNTSDGKLLLVSDDHLFVWSSLVCHYGLPATPVWGSWVIAQLEQQKRIEPLSGFGFNGVAVKVTRKHLLTQLSKGLRNGQIAFPDQNGPVAWPETYLAKWDCLIPAGKVASAECPQNGRPASPAHQHSMTG